MNNKIYNYGISNFRIMALVVMAVITFAGIAAAQETGKVQQGVTIKNVRLWTENNNTVPVCWENPVPGNNMYMREKIIVMKALANTWARHSNIRFFWELECPQPTYDPIRRVMDMTKRNSRAIVRIRISPQGKENAGAGGSARLGM